MTVILSDETVKNLIEAHASMAAWYYQMAEVLRTANMGVSPPSEQQRLAYVRQLSAHFPELGAVAAKITTPRPYVPPPAVAAPLQVTENEGVTVAPPPADLIQTPAMIRGAEPTPAPAAAEPAPPSPEAQPADDAVVPPPPAFVDPNKVKYD